ncbi:hypothetical protein BY458DRAFT_439588 [Sporodiniella umbellata]|nr:hypothetical protein BY458DRAFT_439588 [Sporodiniella umbellata]
MGWIRLFVSLVNKLPTNEKVYRLDVKERSIELDLNAINQQVIYKFKLNPFYHHVIPDKAQVKFKKNKVNILLFKQTEGLVWDDLLMKSTQGVYHALERLQKQTPWVAKKEGPMDTSFFETHECPQHPTGLSKEKV